MSAAPPRRDAARHDRTMQTVLLDPPSSPVVEAAGLVRRYGEGETAVDALRGVDLGIAGGRLTAVMGPSGSGKSTLMHILAGLDRPTEGSVTIAGQDITELGDNDLTLLRREHIGFIFQFFNLLPMLTAEENVVLPLSLAGVKPDREWVRELTDKVGLTRPPQAPPVRALRRPAAARGHRPRARLAADDHVRRRAHGQPRLAHRRRDPRRCCATWSPSLGQTTVMVTHDAHAAAIADRVLFLADGEIVRDLGPSSAHKILDTLEEVTAR